MYQDDRVIYNENDALWECNFISIVWLHLKLWVKKMTGIASADCEKMITWACVQVLLLPLLHTHEFGLHLQMWKQYGVRLIVFFVNLTI